LGHVTQKPPVIIISIIIIMYATTFTVGRVTGDAIDLTLEFPMFDHWTSTKHIQDTSQYKNKKDTPI